MFPRVRLQHYGIGALVFAALLVAYGCSQDPQTRKAAHTQKGMAYIAKEKYAEAILEFKNALLIDPKDAQLYYQIGLASLKKGQAADIRDAFRAFNKVVQLEN